MCSCLNKWVLDLDKIAEVLGECHLIQHYDEEVMCVDIGWNSMVHEWVHGQIPGMFENQCFWKWHKELSFIVIEYFIFFH